MLIMVLEDEVLGLGTTGAVVIAHKNVKPSVDGYIVEKREGILKAVPWYPDHDHLAVVVDVFD